jgi:hypothetical protein
MKCHRYLLLALAAALPLTTLLAAQPPGEGSKEPLVEQVRHVIDTGVAYLKKHKNDQGGWEDYSGDRYRGGTTALALLALLNAGVPRDDPVILNGLDHLGKVANSSTYVRALQTMVYVETGRTQAVQENVNQLLNHALYKDGKLLGWNYQSGRGGAGGPDNSNTQFALLALWVAKQSGHVHINKEFWEQVRDYYGRTQQADGGWKYDTGGISSLTMTAAAVSGLLMAQMELTASDPDRDPVATCGQYSDKKDDPLYAGLRYVGMNFKVALPTHNFYNLYGLERLGRLSGMRFLGQYDWYREGCAYLVKKQHQQGCWDGQGTAEKVVNTSFALLFLSKGRTPVLISKLAHGNLPRQTNDQDWTRRRNDLRHLVDFASKHVFDKMPLAWQNFDMMRTTLTTPSQMDAVTADLLQSPIVYITGYENPNSRLKEAEIAILQKYVENGGFILAVACCGAPAFDKGFHELCQKLFGKEPEPLNLDHTVWNMPFKVPPGSFQLKGVQLGCRTVAIYSPHNLCGYWELNRKDDKGEGEKAFRLGANIIAYATGLQAPKPRLMPMTVAGPTKKEDGPQRGYFKIAQLLGTKNNTEQAKWTPAPKAMRHLAQNLRDETGMDVILDTALLNIDQPEIKSYKFLYMHGRHDFKFSTDELTLLRLNLQNGGLLLADACCGKPAFDKAFRQFLVDLFPQPVKERPRLEPIPFDDDLFSKQLNGESLTAGNIQLRTERGQLPQATRPLLEGIKIHNRWVVIYSKYDIGCALERHQSADCIGYSYDSAVRLSKAAVLYQFALLDKK